MILVLINYSVDADFNETFLFHIGDGGTMTFDVWDWDRLGTVEFLESKLYSD